MRQRFCLLRDMLVLLMPDAAACFTLAVAADTP